MHSRGFILKCLLFFTLTFLSGWLVPYEIPMLASAALAALFFRDWLGEDRPRRLFFSVWATYCGLVTGNQLGAVTAAQSHYKVSLASAVAMHLGFSVVSQLPFAFLLLGWKWVGDRLRWSRLERAAALPLVLYLGDLYLPQLFPGGLLMTLWFFHMPTIQLFSLIGVEGVKWLYYLAIVVLLFLAEAGWTRRPRQALLCGLALLLLVAGALGVGGWEKRRWSATDGVLKFGVYQSAREYDFVSPAPVFLAQEEAVLGDFSRAMEELSEAEPGLDFVIFSETEFLHFFDDGRKIGAGLRQLATRLKIPVFGGTESWLAPGQRQNSFIMINTQGINEHSYAKRLLFPFGEYRPFSTSWPAAAALFPGMEVYVSGTSLDSSVYGFGGVKFGLSICYEDLFFSTFREAARRGAQVFLSITSDGLFGESVIAVAHHEVARGRALEARRPLVRVVRSGPSVVARADGEIILLSPMGQPFSGVASLDFLKNPKLTLYDRWAAGVPVLLLALTAVLIFAARFARRATRG